MKKKKNVAGAGLSQMRHATLQLKVVATSIMETSKTFRKSMVEHFVSLYLISVIVSGLVPELFETKNIYMEIIKMFQNLLTVVKRWHLFSTDEFIRLQTKDQCYFAFSEFGTETTLTGKCMHVNEDSYLEWWKSTLTVSNFKNCF